MEFFYNEHRIRSAYRELAVCRYQMLDGNMFKDAARYLSDMGFLAHCIGYWMPKKGKAFIVAATAVGLFSFFGLRNATIDFHIDADTNVPTNSISLENITVDSK